jgi:lipid-binding SYLF domain-containing protein
MVAIVPAAPAIIVILSLTAILVAEAATVGAPRTRLAGELGAEATAAAEATRTGTPPVHHVVASTLAKKSKNYDAKSPLR